MKRSLNPLAAGSALDWYLALDCENKGHKCARREPVSVEQPDTPTDPVSVEQPDAATLRACTPLCDKFFENLELATDTAQGRELMQFIQDTCFYGDLCWKNSAGDPVQTPMPLALKMEALLEVAGTQVWTGMAKPML